MIKNITFSPCNNSEFVKVRRMHYEQAGVERTWDVAEVHDSVAILLYHVERHAFVLVKQFRPPVFLKNKQGFTYELCAGIVDKEIPLINIAQEEIDEECGFVIPPESLQRITSFYTAVGFAGAEQTLYYAEIDETSHLHEGGGIDVENIEVIYLDVNKAKAFILDESRAKTPGVMYALMWWFETIESSKQIECSQSALQR